VTCNETTISADMLDCTIYSKLVKVQWLLSPAFVALSIHNSLKPGVVCVNS